MSLKRDVSPAAEYLELQQELKRLVKEISYTPFTQSHMLPPKIKRVQAIQLRMSQLRAASPIKLP